MAKKKTEEIIDTRPDAPVADQPITEMLEQNYMPYAMSVIVSRAIPEIDGFKPSHRKLLYTMYKMGLLTKDRTKSANAVGQTMKLNPHGDAAIYETMVRLTRGNEALLHPYVDSKGNFGKQYSRDMAYAASRYTEVKLEKFCELIFNGIDKNAVDMVDNYDGELKEPALLPVAFPSILVNSNMGIAVGMASNICSFNLKEVCEATIAHMKDPSADLLDIMPAPDFSGGGQILYDQKVMKEIYETGRGSIRIRGKYTVDAKKNTITIYEIPYTTTMEAIIDEVCELVKQGKIKEISDIRNSTDLKGLKIVIECKRGTDHDALMTKLFKFTKLESPFSCNFNVLVNGSPKVLGVYGLMDEWLKWRRECIKRETAFDLQKKKDRLHLLEGLAKILLDIDKAIAIIRNTELEEDVVPNLMKGFDIDQIQAEYVAEIKLRNINKQYILNRIKDVDDIKNEIADLEDFLVKPKRIDNKIIEVLKDVIKKYGQERRSEVVRHDEVQSFEPSQVIEDYKVRVMLTKDGYLKKHTLVSLRSAGELKTKEEDEIFIDKETSNVSDLLFFTDKANVYKAKTYELNETKPSEYGHYLPSTLGMEDGEKVVHMIVTSDYKGNLMIGFENGKAAIFPINVYETKQNRKKLVNAFFGGSPAVAFLEFAEGESKDLVARSDISKAVLFDSSLIPMKSTRTTQGVQLLTSKRGSKMISIETLEQAGFSDPEYFRIRKIPAIGYFIKDELVESRQINLNLDGI